MPNEETNTPAPTPGLTDDWWQKHLEAERKHYQETIEKLKPVLVEMANRGVAAITVTYDGCGDSGSIESVTLLDKDNQSVTVKTDDDVDHNGAIESFAYAFLENHHGGWENNEGAYGEITIDTATHKAKLVHNGRIEEVVTDEHETDI